MPRTVFNQLFAGILATLCVTACTNDRSVNSGNGAQTPSPVAEQEPGAMPEELPDSMPEEQAEPETKAPAIPQMTFASTQEALDYMSSSAHASEYAEGIIPQMASDELSYATKLINNPYDKFLIIDKQLMRVGLFDKYGREILSYGIACARNYGTKHKKADSRTPEGFFSVEGIYDSTDWLFTDDNGRTSKKKGQFGPRFIRIKNPVSTQIGLHGTCSPWSIGSRGSHGCIRVTNENILELVKHVTPGMPVIISPSKRDQQVNEKEGYKIAMVTMDPYGKYSASATAHPVKKKDKKAAEPSGETMQPEEKIQEETSPETAPEPHIIPEEAPADTLKH